MDIPRLSDTIASELEHRILEGSLRPGQRLPPERELAEQLGVSRPSLREGLRKLASRGLVRSRQGGGTFVTDRLQSSFVDPWKQLLESHPDLRGDLLEFRHMLESHAAALASQRANAVDLEAIGVAWRRLEQAYEEDDLEGCAEADVAFHQAIAEASHNALIAHLSASLHRLIADNISDNLRHLHRIPAQWRRLREQHRAIWLGLSRHDAGASAQAAREHVSFVQSSMIEREREGRRIDTAQRRAATPSASGPGRRTQHRAEPVDR